jgi:hypothetical protein
MININAGATNSVVLRLDELADIYLFEVRSIQSNEVFYFTAANISPTTRFFECKIYETSGTGDIIALTASTPSIKLTYGGSYNYTLYGTNNFDLQPTENILDKGKLVFRNGEYQSFFFEIDDELISGVFEEYSEEVVNFNFGDDISYAIFDPEFDTFFLLTEEGDILMTEQNENIIWN